MSKRLQILVPDQEYAVYKKHAKANKLPLAAWARGVLRRVSSSESTKSIEAKLRALEISSSYSAPAGPISTMKEEIMRGYLKS